MMKLPRTHPSLRQAVRVVRDTYTSHEVARLAGITYRQLDYWCRVGMIPGQPSLSTIGSGHRRRWSEGQLRFVRRLAVAARLRAMRLDEMLDWLARVDVLDLLVDTEPRRTVVHSFDEASA